MSRLAKSLLVITAYAPMLLVYSIVSVLGGERVHAVWFLVWCVVLAVLCDVMLCFERNRLEPMRYRTDTVEPADDKVFDLLLIYLLPLITRDLTAFNWYSWVLIGLFVCAVTVVGYGYHCNPLLVLFKYHFYKVTEKSGVAHILITKRRIYRTGEKLRVGRFAEYVLIEKTSPDED